MLDAVVEYEHWSQTAWVDPNSATCYASLGKLLSKPQFLPLKNGHNDNSTQPTGLLWGLINTAKAYGLVPTCPPILAADS